LYSVAFGTVKAKFHYAIWFEAGSNLSATSFEQVRAISTCRDRSNLLEAGRGPIADLLARASSLGQISARCKSATSFEPASNQIA